MSIPALAAAIQGQGTVSADNLNTFTQTAQTTSQLRNFTGLPGMAVWLQGVSFANDGSGGFFYWNPSGTEPDDNFNYIVPNDTSSGEWERLTIASTVGGAVFTTIVVTGLSTFDGDVTIYGILSESIATGLVGAGSTQGTATPLTANLNVASTVGSGTGFILPTLTPDGNSIKAGTQIWLFNRGSNTANLYPPSGAQIESLGANNPFSVAAGADAIATFAGSGQWSILYVTATFPYDIGFYSIGAYISSQVMAVFVIDRTINYATNFTPSRAVSSVAATSTAVITILKNGTQIGTITFAASGKVGTYSGSAVTFVAGDILSFVAPATSDATLANVSITYSGNRSA